jgi:hypothetical protein
MNTTACTSTRDEAAVADDPQPKNKDIGYSICNGNIKQ